MQGRLKFCLMSYKYSTSILAELRLLVHKLGFKQTEKRALGLNTDTFPSAVSSLRLWPLQCLSSREHGQLSLPQCWQESDLGITTLSSHGISREPGAEPSEQILSISYILLNLDAMENIPLNLGTYKVLQICPSTFPCQLWLHLSSGYTSQASAEPRGGPCAWSSPAREVMRLWTAALGEQSWPASVLMWTNSKSITN